MISILMPVYNGIEFINESVQSVIEQSYNDWELLIGINGHSKNSEVYKKAKFFEDNYNNIRVFDFYNISGKANTLNEMIKYCKYDYVALLDVDDIWHPQKLKIQSFWLNIYDVIGTKCVWFGQGESHGVVPFIPQNDFSNFNFADVNPIINSSVILRKELCYWIENGLEDYDLWIRLRKQNKKFYNCPEILVKHRIHEKSAFNSGGKNNNKVPDLLRFHNMISY